jgi:hypothetical protein
MRKLILLCTSLCAIVLLLSASPVRAQNVLWVSANGNDAAACSQTAPCATFQGAINKGSVIQINCLTSGYFGPVTITASITIDCGVGNIGNVNAVANGNAITINTTSAATIVLRHLSLFGAANTVGVAAVPFSMGILIVEDCMIQGFHSGSGIFFAPSGGRGMLQVSNTQIFDNGNGIGLFPSSGQVASVTLDKVELVGNSNVGLNLTGPGVVAGTMRHSVIGENIGAGVVADAGQVFFTIEESSLIANLGFGVQTNSAGSVVNVGASTIGANGTGVNALSGSIFSFGNNQMSANGSNGNFTGTTALR